MDMKLSLFEARDQGRDWSVLTDADGFLTECAGANIFVVKDNTLFTPDSGCLEGITRQSTLEIASMIGVQARVERVHADQLRNADEAFMTTSAGGVIPIRSVDGVVIGKSDGPGVLATKFHNSYWEKMWAGWNCWPVDYRETE